jgi:hypothetical protein
MKTAIHRLWRFTMASFISVLLYLYVHEQALRDRVGLGLVAAIACFLTIEGGGRVLEARRERREAVQRENHRKHQIEADERLRARVRAEYAQAPKAEHVLRVAPETPPAPPQRRRLRWWTAPLTILVLIGAHAGIASAAVVHHHHRHRHAHHHHDAHQTHGTLPVSTPGPQGASSAPADPPVLGTFEGATIEEPTIAEVEQILAEATPEEEAETAAFCAGPWPEEGINSPQELAEGRELLEACSS